MMKRRDIEPGIKMPSDTGLHSHGLPLSKVYHWYVQGLYKYGMLLCGDREFVLKTIGQLFIQLQSQGKLHVTVATIQFCLFKRFRDLISTFPEGDNSLTSSTRLANRQPKEAIGPPFPELSRRQREAAFLKLYCQFSYEHVASVMQLDPESIYVLVTQAFEILRRQCKKESFSGGCIADAF